MNTTQRDDRGQVLVIVALGLIVIVAMVGLVIDGGFAWSKQRATQNAADSVAEAGAVVLASTLVNVSPAKTDGDVMTAVNTAATNNQFATPSAWYTNFNGNLINAAGAVVGTTAQAAKVGDGVLPPGAKGVQAQTAQTVNTFLMSVIGIRTLDVTATATARVGYQQNTCAAESGCVILPVTIPTTVLGCDGQNDPAPAKDGSGNSILYTAPGPVQTVPLCKNGPGNVGWIDWTPTAGGASELEAAILTPSNPAMSWPGWYYITATGNMNSSNIESALRTYDGKVVQIPMFDNTCDATPTGPGVNDCPAGHLGGNGSNQWYHINSMASFKFCSTANATCTGMNLQHGAYINGNDRATCDTGNGGTSCLAGNFTIISGRGSVTEAPPPGGIPGSVSVQLIR